MLDAIAQTLQFAIAELWGGGGMQHAHHDMQELVHQILQGDAQQVGGEGAAYQHLAKDRPPRHRVKQHRAARCEGANARRGTGEFGGRR